MAVAAIVQRTFAADDIVVDAVGLHASLDVHFCQSQRAQSGLQHRSLAGESITSSVSLKRPSPSASKASTISGAWPPS